MKSAATKLFLVLMVSIQTPVGQLFKLPVLIEHYLKHQKDEDVSLLGFLANHYTTDHNDADLPEDKQLPFKSFTFYSLGNAIVTPVIQSAVFTVLPAGKKVFFPYTYTQQQHLTNIFHPPRW